MSTPSILSAIRKLRELLTREEKLKCAGIAVFALCTSMFEIVTAAVLVVFAQVLNQPTVGREYLSKLGFSSELSTGRVIFYVAVIFSIVYLIKNLIAAAEVFFQHFSIQKMNYSFKNKLLYRYAQTDYSYYLTRNSSLGMQVVGGDTEQMFTNGMMSMAAIMSESIVSICLLSMFIVMNPKLAILIFAVGIALGIIINKWMLPQFYRWGIRLQAAAVDSHRHIMQFFHSFKEIILLGKRDTFIQSYKIHSKTRMHVQAMQSSINALPRMVIELLFIGLFVLSIAYLCLAKEPPIHMIGILGGYLYMGFRLMPGLNRVINQLNNFKSAIPSIDRVYDEYTATASKDNYIDIPDFSFDKTISLKHVSFRYLNTDKFALNEITIDIKKGECIGIVGETGSGKSTLVDVLLGLLRPEKGGVLIDGKYPVNCYQWHQRIGYVPQSVYLIDDTIEANIAFGEKIIDADKLQLAINAAQLDKLIQMLPEGSKTEVGERGMRLSGGERQRIAIARALYHNPEVLIFDEATSALDNETEARLMSTIDRISQSHTVIMIAHRLTTLKNCDSIYKFNKGGVQSCLSYAEIISHVEASHA